MGQRFPVGGDDFNTDMLKIDRGREEDGRWIAYNALDSGRWEVYVASYPSFTQRRQYR